MTNTSVDIPALLQLARAAQARADAAGSQLAEAYAADAVRDVPALCAAVEQLAMLYQASQDALGKVIHEHAEFSRKVDAYRAGVGQQGAGFPWGDEE